MLEILKKKRQEGFTLVELLIVIVIIAILAALVIVTFSGVQARARNTERQTDISALAKYLEIYYTSQSTYPIAGDITNSNVNTVKSNLAAGNASGLDVAALSAPGQTGNSYGSVTSTGPNSYGYVPVGAATPCTATPCTSYTLSWTEEASGTTPQSTKTKASANN